MEFKELKFEEITKVIEPICAMQTKQWFLASAEVDGEVRTLTCAWGALGNVWKKKTMTIYIRPQRHTLPFIEQTNRFTATFFDGHIEEMSYLGTVSAKDVKDKIEKSGLHVEHINGNPTFREGKYVIVCRVLYKHQLDPNEFIEKDVCNKAYPNKDYSYMFVGEIESAWEII